MCYIYVMRMMIFLPGLCFHQNFCFKLSYNFVKEDLKDA